MRGGEHGTSHDHINMQKRNACGMFKREWVDAGTQLSGGCLSEPFIILNG